MIKINDGSKDKIYSSNIELIDNFTDYSSKNLDFDKPVEIDFLDNEDNAKNPLGTTAHYNPDEMKITIYVTGRHLKDILRSISHELIHHVQNCRGDFNGMEDTGLGYAQKDKHMRNMEQEAYTSGNIMNFRDFEDTYKKENRRMKTPLKELKKIINEEAQAVIAEIARPELKNDEPTGSRLYIINQLEKALSVAKKHKFDEGPFADLINTVRKNKINNDIFLKIKGVHDDINNQIKAIAAHHAETDLEDKQLGTMTDYYIEVRRYTRNATAAAHNIVKSASKSSGKKSSGKRKCLKLPLGRGCTGELVKKIQKLLILVGYRRQLGKTGADGDYGGRTVRAVKEFQKDNTSLKVDGVVGKLTFQALKELAKDIKANSGPVHKKAKPASASPIPKRFTAQQIGTVLKNMNKVVSPEDPKAKAIIKKLMRAQDKGELLDLKKIKLVADAMLLPDDTKPISN
jgi:murein L,D-transpeptidase YcbB/YkuD